MKALLISTLLLCFGSLGASAVVFVTLRSDVEELEFQLSVQKADARSGEEASQQNEPAIDLSSLESRISALENKVGPLLPSPEDKGTPLTPALPGDPGLGEPEIQHPGAGGKEGQTPPQTPAEREASLAKKVKDLESKLGEVQKKIDKDGKEDKPKFAQLAARLDLDSVQRDAVQDILRRGKTELLEHLQKPLADGTVLVNEFAEMMFQTSKDPKAAEEQGKKIFMRLFSEKVPGMEKTYIQVIGDLNGRVKSEMKDQMTDEQKKRYDEWSPDPTDIELENDPINKYLMDYVARRNEEEGK